MPPSAGLPSMLQAVLRVLWPGAAPEHAELSAAEYKAAKEVFVSNHTGTTLSEIVLTTLALPAALWVYAEYKALRQLSCKIPYSLIPTFGVEFFVLIFPQIVVQTAPHLKLPLLSVFCLLAWYWHRKVSRAIYGTESPSPGSQPLPTSDKAAALCGRWQHERAGRLTHPTSRNFLSNYRAGIMLTSAIAILAVDFPVFPRRFAKAETFGTGLMDLGVGCFMFSGGLCSRPARTYHVSRQSGWHAMAHTGVTGAGATMPVRALWSTIRRCIPLFLLGVGRLLVHRTLDYQEHVSEYGVHWNFFLTIVAVYLAAAFFHTFLPYKALIPFSIVIMILYQMKLSLGELTEYLLYAPRRAHDPLSQNREGILGTLGFLCLYLLGEQVGSWTIWRHIPPGGGIKAAEQEARRALVKLIMLDVCLWIGTCITGSVVQPVSRRLVNMSYVLWACAQNVLVITLLLAVDSFASIPAASMILGSVNRNELAFFLAANLLTGAVNFSMRTIFCSDAVAMSVIISYIAGLVFVFTAIDRIFYITLKLW